MAVTIQTKPDQFLRSFGLKPLAKNRRNAEEFERKMIEAGADPTILDRNDPFGPLAAEVYHASDRVARHLLSCEFVRIQGVMDHTDWLIQQLPGLKYVADLGGREGMLAFFISAVSPVCQVTVYDHAPRCLELGKRWASRKRLRRVEFKLADYHSIANSTGLPRYDLVIFSHGIFAEIPNPLTETRLLDLDACRGIAPKPSKTFLDAIAAIHRLLSDSGIALVTLAASAWGLINILEACRQQDLCVDWRLSDFGALPSGNDLGPFYLAIRKGNAHLMPSSFEDAEALLGLAFDQAIQPREHILVNKPSTDATNLLVNCAGKTAKGHHQSITLWREDGLLFLAADGCDASKRIRRGSLLQLEEFLDLAQEELNHWQDQDGEVTQFYVSPTVRRYQEFCEQHPLE